MPGAQRGAALLVVLAFLILITAAILLDKLNAAVAPTPSRDPVSMETLARAKEALIAWSATHPQKPGLLPFPDRNDDDLLATADAPARYDGASDCDISGAIAPTHLLGRLPFVGEQVGCTTGANVAMSIDVDDSSGERLWYAVSQNLVLGGDGGPINPDIGELGTRPWITVRDQAGAVISNQVAAVIIAPGPALSGQDRGATAPGAANFLDSVVVGAATYDNSDADGCPDAGGCGTPGEEFIINSNPQPGDNFNDRLVFITVDELMRAVEDRVLGEAAQALRSYRGVGDVYPWLSPFSNPRARLGGTATGGTATSLIDTNTNFIVAGVLVGHLVRNLNDGSARTVTAVAINTLTLFSQGLIGGATNSFAAGDDYVVHTSTKFDGVAGNVDGMLPIAFPGKLFQTGFTVNWNFSGEDNSATWDDGNPGLIPTVSDVDDFNGNDLIVPFPDGTCKWTQTDRVDCMGTATLPNTPVAGITRTVEVSFNFTADTTTVVAPTGATGRRRNHTFNGTNYGPVTPLPAPDLPQNVWSVHVEDDDGTNRAWRRAERDSNTDLVITITGIRYEDLDVPGDLPRWFVDNYWHHFVHVALSGANAPTSGTTSGDGTCTTPPTGAGNEPDDCLTVAYNLAMVRDDVEALVIGPGAVLVALPQNRNTATACASQPAFLCDYFETPNSDPEATTRNLIYGRAPANTFEVSTTFNDQIRPVLP